MSCCEKYFPPRAKVSCDVGFTSPNRRKTKVGLETTQVLLSPDSTEVFSAVWVEARSQWPRDAGSVVVLAGSKQHTRRVWGESFMKRWFAEVWAEMMQPPREAPAL